MDNGSSVSNQRLDFYLNDTILFSDLTGNDGSIEFAIPFPGVIKAVFAGSDYMNPSESQIGNGFEIENATEIEEFNNNEFESLSRTLKIEKLTIKIENITKEVHGDWDYDLSEKVDKTYYIFYMNIFNNFSKESGIYSFEDRTVFTLNLIDNLGNVYEPINAKKSPVEIKGMDFSKDMSIHPQTMKEGYLVFSEIEKEAKELKLIFNTEEGKAVFEFNVVEPQPYTMAGFSIIPIVLLGTIIVCGFLIKKSRKYVILIAFLGFLFLPNIASATISCGSTTITVTGDATCGNTEANACDFNDIYTACGSTYVERLGTSTFYFHRQLYIGDSSTTTYVRTTMETATWQNVGLPTIEVRTNGYFISGQKSGDSTYGGSTLQTEETTDACCEGSEFMSMET